MADPFQLNKIREALSQLDPQTEAHWTEEGFPQIEAVRQLTGDPSVKRQDIQAARPGFARPKPEDAAAAPIEPIAPVVEAPAPVVTADGFEEFGSEEELRKSYEQDVRRWEDELGKARQKIADGHREEKDAAKNLAKAKEDLQAQFPPMTASDNIKAHLASEQAMRRMRVEGRGAGPSQLDQAMRRSTARGWRRPKRTIAGPTQTGAVS